MENKLLQYNKIQEQVKTSRNIHNKIIKLEDNKRSQDLGIIRYVRNSLETEYVIAQSAYIIKKELKDLLTIDEKLNDMLNKNKYDFKIARQN